MVEWLNFGVTMLKIANKQIFKCIKNALIKLDTQKNNLFHVLNLIINTSMLLNNF
jgi:hypothetical protein